MRRETGLLLHSEQVFEPREFKGLEHPAADATGGALRLVDAERPHLVLLDMVLPGADGIELMKEIARASLATT